MSLKRRWYLALAALVVIVAGVGGLLTVVKPSYDSTARVVLIPPEYKNDPGNNRYLNLANIGDSVEVVAQSMSSDATRSQLAASSPQASYTVATDATTSAPILDVVASSKNPAAAQKMLGAVLDQLPQSLDTLQQDVNVVPGSRITSIVLARDNAPAPNQKTRIRLVGLAVVVIVAFFAILIAFVDGMLLRRAGRGRGRARKQRRRERTTPVPESEAPTAESVPRTSEAAGSGRS